VCRLAGLNHSSPLSAEKPSFLTLDPLGASVGNFSVKFENRPVPIWLSRMSNSPAPHLPSPIDPTIIPVASREEAVEKFLLWVTSDAKDAVQYLRTLNENFEDSIWSVGVRPQRAKQTSGCRLRMIDMSVNYICKDDWMCLERLNDYIEQFEHSGNRGISLILPQTSTTTRNGSSHIDSMLSSVNPVVVRWFDSHLHSSLESKPTRPLTTTRPRP